MPHAILFWNIGFESEPNGPGSVPLEVNGNIDDLGEWSDKASSAKILESGWLVLFSRAGFHNSQTWIQGPREIPDFRQIVRARLTNPYNPVGGLLGWQDFNDDCEAVMWFPNLNAIDGPPASGAQGVAVYRLDTPLTLGAPGVP